MLQYRFIKTSFHAHLKGKIVFCYLAPRLAMPRGLDIWAEFFLKNFPLNSSRMILRVIQPYRENWS